MSGTTPVYPIGPLEPDPDAARAAAGDTRTDRELLREAVARAIEASDQAGLAAALADELGGVDDPYGRNADAVLALPEMAPLLDGREANER